MNEREWNRLRGLCILDNSPENGDEYNEYEDNIEYEEYEREESKD